MPGDVTKGYFRRMVANIGWPKYIYSGSTSGSTTVQASAVASGTLTLPAATDTLVGKATTDTLTNKTLTDFINGGVTRVTAQTDATTTTLANITGLSQAVSIGTYAFDIYLPITCGGTGGVKLAFNYTTAALSALSAMAYGFTASAIATASTTTTTTQTTIISAATAFTSVCIKGTMVVSTAGTVALQFAENNANSTSSVLVGGYMNFTRIA